MFKFKPMFLVASIACALAAPAVAETQEFPPGFSPEQKFAWAKLSYPAICRAPLPDQLKNIRFDKLQPEEIAAIDSMTKQTAIGFIKSKCGMQPNMATAYN